MADACLGKRAGNQRVIDVKLAIAGAGTPTGKELLDLLEKQGIGHFEKQNGFMIFT